MASKPQTRTGTASAPPVAEIEAASLARAKDLRQRARTHEQVSWLFLIAMLVALLGGGLLFYYSPLLLADQDKAIIARETRNAKIEALEAGKTAMIDILLGSTRERAKRGTLPYLVKAEPVDNDARYLSEVFLLEDGRRGWAVGDSGTIRATSDGGKIWTEQASGTENHLASVQFLADGLRGWAVGSNGTILRLETCDFSAISDAKTYQDYGAALLALSADAPDLRSHYDDAFLTIEKKIKEYVASIAEFKKEIQQLDRDNSQAKVQGLFDEREWFSFARSSVTRLGVVGFFVYFISLLSNLYRYMIRMAAFYNARADALMLMDPSKIGFDVLVDKLAPDALSFGKQGAGPMDHAFELAKTAVTALARK